MSSVKAKENPTSTYMEGFSGRVEIHNGCKVKHIAEFYRSNVPLELMPAPQAERTSRTEAKVFKTRR